MDTKCFFHRDAEAVAVCSECGKKICRKCAVKHIPPVCPGCINIRNFLSGTYIAILCIFTVLLFIISLVICNLFHLAPWLTAIIVYTMTCAPYGWRVLNRLLPPYMLALPRFIFILFIVLKFTVSAVIGIGAVPVHIVKMALKLLRRAG